MIFCKCNFFIRTPMSPLTYLIAFMIFTIVWSNDSSKVEIIQIPARNERDFSTSPTHFYFKYQTPSHFNMSVSDIYIRVPSLRTIFNLAQPTLFEITYQGSCEVHKGKGVHIKLLVDDHLIVGDLRICYLTDCSISTCSCRTWYTYIWYRSTSWRYRFVFSHLWWYYAI
jgi:hypothetical protein